MIALAAVFVVLVAALLAVFHRAQARKVAALTGKPATSPEDRP